MNLDSCTKRFSLVSLIAILVALLLVSGCRIFPQLGGTPTPTQIMCPEATPEYFDVYAVTSPTDQLTQVISAELGNGETITVTTESGVFTAPVDTYPTEIEITLLPNTTHNLTVEGKVREVQQGDCTYGGYTLSTTRDRDGQPLVIEQNQP
ncbi:MAG: hypothetical protein R3C44_17845 [Chloroflexota bacterium]